MRQTSKHRRCMLANLFLPEILASARCQGHEHQRGQRSQSPQRPLQRIGRDVKTRHGQNRIRHRCIGRWQRRGLGPLLVCPSNNGVGRLLLETNRAHSPHTGETVPIPYFTNAHAARSGHLSHLGLVRLQSSWPCRFSNRYARIRASKVAETSESIMRWASR